MTKRLLFLSFLPIFFLSLTNKSQAQTGVKFTQLIQMSGVIVDKDSIQSIPYVAVIVKRSYGGTISDFSGYFSLIVVPGDTIVFQAIGYRTNFYRVPDTLSTDKYSLIHIMARDTTNLKPVQIVSWPSKEAFKAAFLKLDIPNNDLDRARNNMALAARKARYGSDNRSPGVNYLNTMQQEYDQLYYAGQFPPNELFNPVAWAKFIQAWKDGSLNVQ